MSFEAKYSGVCDACGERIRIGELIRYSDDYSRPIHGNCDAGPVQTEVDRDANREVCQKCWLLTPCECEVA